MSNRADAGAEAMATSERMKTLMRAKAHAKALTAKGEHETTDGSRHSVEPGVTESIIAAWPEGPKMAAQALVARYGAPNEATPTKLFWYNNGPWKRTELTSDMLVHNFPTPHVDFLTQWIDYRVPLERLSDIARYDGSCLVDRTAGEAGARCDSEAANIVTLNFMHEIVTGQKAVDEAREAYAESLTAYTMGRPAPHSERLLFDVPSRGSEDPDEDMGMAPMVRQAAGKVKDALTGEAPPPADR
ncbi:MAG: hypothetical protein ACREOK_15285 [Gemmatimonadaceae bacterium]